MHPALTFDAMIERYGLPHTWDQYTRWLNGWRLILEMTATRVIIDIALHCPVTDMAVKACNLLGDMDLPDLDEHWPGRGDFSYGWKPPGEQEA